MFFFANANFKSFNLKEIKAFELTGIRKICILKEYDVQWKLLLMNEIRLETCDTKI